MMKCQHCELPALGSRIPYEHRGVLTAVVVLCWSCARQFFRFHKAVGLAGHVSRWGLHRHIEYDLVHD